MVSFYSLLDVSGHFTWNGICRSKLQIHYTIKTLLLLAKGLSPLLNKTPSMSFSLFVLFSSTQKVRGSVISYVSQSVYRPLSRLFANYVMNVDFPLIRVNFAPSFVQILYSGPD